MKSMGEFRVPFFYLLVITLIIPARYLFMILMATQAPYLSLPGSSVGIDSSDLCKSPTAAFKLHEHVDHGWLGLICLL